MVWANSTRYSKRFSVFLYHQSNVRFDHEETWETERTWTFVTREPFEKLDPARVHTSVHLCCCLVNAPKHVAHVLQGPTHSHLDVAKPRNHNLNLIKFRINIKSIIRRLPTAHLNVFFLSFSGSLFSNEVACALSYSGCRHLAIRARLTPLHMSLRPQGGGGGGGTMVKHFAFTPRHLATRVPFGSRADASLSVAVVSHLLAKGLWCFLETVGNTSGNFDSTSGSQCGAQCGASGVPHCFALINSL